MGFRMMMGFYILLVVPSGLNIGWPVDGETK